MANAAFRIFLSAVSSEFRSARNELTDDFGARDVLVGVRDRVRTVATYSTGDYPLAPQLP